jgi:type IV secretory pathway VirB4 component
LTLPSHTAYAGASVFARALLSTQRLVPDLTDIVSSTATSKLSSSDKLRISDAFIESSKTKSTLSRQKSVFGQITSQNSIMPQDSQIILQEPQPREQVSSSSHVEPPVLVNKASSTSNLLISSNPVDARSKLATLSLKLQKAKK